MKGILHLSSLGNIIVYNVLLVVNGGKPKLQVCFNGFMAKASMAVQRPLVVVSLDRLQYIASYLP